MRYGMIGTTLVIVTLLSGCAEEPPMAPFDGEPLWGLSQFSSHAQDLKPIADESNPGAWSQPVWEGLISADDNSYTFRNHWGPDPGVFAATVWLENPPESSCPSANQEFTLKIRWKVLGDYVTTTPLPTRLAYALRKGTTEDIAWGFVEPSGSYVTKSHVLTQSQIDKIVSSCTTTPWLTIWFEAILNPEGFNMLQARISYAWLEIR